MNRRPASASGAMNGTAAYSETRGLPARLADDAPAPQLGEHKIGQRDRRRERDIRGSPPCRDIREALLPGAQSGLVGIDRGKVDRHVHALLALRVEEAQVALQRRF